MPLVLLKMENGYQRLLIDSFRIRLVESETVAMFERVKHAIQIIFSADSMIAVD